MLDRELRIKYLFSTRADNIYNPQDTVEQDDEREAAFGLMVTSGLRKIFVGLESGAESGIFQRV